MSAFRFDIHSTNGASLKACVGGCQDAGLNYGLVYHDVGGTGLYGFKANRIKGVKQTRVPEGSPGEEGQAGAVIVHKYIWDGFDTHWEE